MGGPTSPALALGEAMARSRPSMVPGVPIQIRSSVGAIDNIEAIQSGVADIGLATADLAYFSFVGQLEPDEKPFDRLRAIAVLTQIPVNLVVKSDSNIHGVSDLRGKRVGVGEVGTSSLITASVVLKAFGVDLDMIHAERVPLNNAPAELEAGTLDAYFINGYLEPPSDFVRPDRRVLPLAGGGVDQLRREYPFLRPMRVPSGVYPGGAVRTVGVDWLLVCRSGLDESIVYNFTKSFFKNLSSLSSVVDALRFMDLERAPATPIPLHEGAARYYREREIAQ
jgi:TRAP transporter TAXI family solute receptor